VAEGLLAKLELKEVNSWVARMKQFCNQQGELEMAGALGPLDFISLRLGESRRSFDKNLLLLKAQIGTYECYAKGERPDFSGLGSGTRPVYTANLGQSKAKCLVHIEQLRHALNTMTALIEFVAGIPGTEDAAAKQTELKDSYQMGARHERLSEVERSFSEAVERTPIFILGEHTDAALRREGGVRQSRLVIFH